MCAVSHDLVLLERELRLGRAFGVGAPRSAASVGINTNVVQNESRGSRHKQKDQHVAEREISAAQCRGARGMLAWNQSQLADGANVSRMTVVEFEGGRRAPHSNNLTAIRTALEAAGVEFMNGNSPGVRLRKAKQ